MIAIHISVSIAFILKYCMYLFDSFVTNWRLAGKDVTSRDSFWKIVAQTIFSVYGLQHRLGGIVLCWKSLVNLSTDLDLKDCEEDHPSDVCSPSNE